MTFSIISIIFKWGRNTKRIMYLYVCNLAELMTRLVLRPYLKVIEMLINVITVLLL